MKNEAARNFAFHQACPDVCAAVFILLSMKVLVALWSFQHLRR